MPAFRYLGRILVYFAAFRDHCSLFPASTKVMRRFAEDLEGFGTTGKGTTHFTAERSLPPALVEAIVGARVAEIEAGRAVSRVRGVERRGG